jgi:hypothetical protein
MNILKLQDELKGVPDNALIGYVQSPTGQVPTYLALGELQRRKTMREKFQQQQAPQTTVAEDLAAPPPPPPMQQGIAAVAPQQMAAPMQEQAPMMPPQGMAEGGLAGLDVGNMYDEANYATGGIVAFADGGETESNYLDSQAPLNLNTGMGGSSGLGGDALYAFNDKAAMSPVGRMLFEKMPESARGEFINSGMGAFFGLQERPKNEYYTSSGALTSSYADGGEVKRFAGLDGSYVNPSMYGGPVQEYEPWYKSLKLLGEKYNLYGDGLLGPNPEQDTIRAFENQRSMNPFISGMPRTDLADEYARLRLKASENKATQKDYDRMNEINQSMKPAENYPTGGGATKESIAAMQQADAAKAAKDAQEKLLKDKEKALRDMANANTAGSKSGKENIRSLADYAKEFRDVVGEDPMQKALMQRMEKMDASAAKQAEQAPWMALAQAGFGMAAGKSPFALQNIAAGAIEGVKSYGDARDKMTSLEEKRFSLMADMAKAQRAEQLAIASKGVDSRDAQLAREQQERLNDKKMANDMQMRLLDNTFDLQKTRMQTAAKDLPNAVERATKIKPLVPEHPTYKPRVQALIARLGDKSVEPGSPRHKEYVDGVKAIESEIYNELISRPGISSSADLNYVPGKGFSF